jgi:hypothetical protein
MERSAPASAIAHPHLDDLRALVERPGPHLTSMVARPEPMGSPADPAVNEARRAASQSALADRADDLANAVADAFPEAPAVVVIGDAEGIELVEHLDEAPRTTGTSCGELPRLAAIIERRSADVPVVSVTIDRTGADLTWSSPLPAGATATGETEVDPIRTHHLRKIRKGGWSHRRIQQRAEDAWERTAAEVAEATASLARSIDARVVLARGDERMIHLLCDELPDEIAAIVREVPGSRSEDGSGPAGEEEAARWLRTAVAEDTRSLLARFDEELGQADRAAAGWADVFASLREGRVEVLLVHDDGGEGPDASFVPDQPGLVALRAEELTSLGAEDVRTARATDVAIRAALLTGADLRIVPTTPRLSEGVGAILRW